MHADSSGSYNNVFNTRVAKKLDFMAKSIEELRNVVNSQANTLRDLLDLNYYMKNQLESVLGPQPSVDLSQINIIRQGAP